MVNVVRIPQLDCAQYASQAECATWAYSTCSTASLAEILNAYGGHYRVTDVLKVEAAIGCITPSQGVLSSQCIATTAEKFGMAVSWGTNWSYDKLIATANSGTPVIVDFPPSKYAGGHLLIVTGGDASGVRVVDSSGWARTFISFGQFMAWWGTTAFVVTPPGGVPKPVTSVIPNQEFSKLGLVAWWNQPVTQSFGQNGEMGADYGMGSFGVPIGNLMPGKVVYAGSYPPSPGSSIGRIVQVLGQDGILYHYQHMQAMHVAINQQVAVGTVLGTAGGCPDGCYGAHPACTCYDQFSSGEHIEVRAARAPKLGGGVGQLENQVWFDPRAFFKGIAAQPVSTSISLGNFPGSLDFTGSNLSFSQRGPTGPSFSLPKTALAPNSSVTELLVGIDNVETIGNPFDVNLTADHISGNILGQGIDIQYYNPATWLFDVGANAFADLGAVLIRAAFIIIGFILIYKVLTSFIDFGQVSATAFQAARLSLVSEVR